MVGNTSRDVPATPTLRNRLTLTRRKGRSDGARDGGDAHAAQFVGNGLWDWRFRLRVVPDSRVHDGVEVERAHLPHRQPDMDEGLFGLQGIC